MSMFTIFRCSFGDCNTANGQSLFVLVTRDFGWVFGMLYGMFIFVMTIGVFNVISAIFVENVLSTSQRNERAQRRKRLSDETVLAASVATIMHCVLRQIGYERPALRLSEDFEHVKDRKIDREIFAKVLQDPQGQQALIDLDIALEDHENLFELLDSDGSGGLHFDDLVVGLEKLRGDPRRSDIVCVDLMMRAFHVHMHNVVHRLDFVCEACCELSEHFLELSPPAV
jgi:Ca2+-binding EF-hand superfamily protein